jgi:prepilin-type N-terminal cleavage/methylation domain-containing protein
MIRRRNGFTMVELVFVIIIIGILAAIALPRFVGISDEAQRSLCESAIGTMNRTVGLSLWSKSLSDGNGGNVTSYIDDAMMIKHLPDYNETYCGVIVDLNVGDLALEDGEFGSPRYINEGNSTHAPSWIWVKK